MSADGTLPPPDQQQEVPPGQIDVSPRSDQENTPASSKSTSPRADQSTISSNRSSVNPSPKSSNVSSVWAVLQQLDEELWVTILTFTSYRFEIDKLLQVGQLTERINFEHLVTKRLYDFTNINGIVLTSNKDDGVGPEWLGYYRAFGSRRPRSEKEDKSYHQRHKRLPLETLPTPDEEYNALPTRFHTHNHVLNDWYMHPHRESYLWFKNEKTGHYIHFCVTWRLSTPNGKRCLYFDKGAKIRKRWGIVMEHPDGKPKFDQQLRNGPAWHRPHQHQLPPRHGKCWKCWQDGDSSPDFQLRVEYDFSGHSPEPARQVGPTTTLSSTSPAVSTDNGTTMASNTSHGAHQSLEGGVTPVSQSSSLQVHSSSTPQTASKVHIVTNNQAALAPIPETRGDGTAGSSSTIERQSVT